MFLLIHFQLLIGMTSMWQNEYSTILQKSQKLIDVSSDKNPKIIEVKPENGY